jgi:hypothetical protein
LLFQVDRFEVHLHVDCLRLIVKVCGFN